MTNVTEDDTRFASVIAETREKTIDEVAAHVEQMHACWTDKEGNCLTISHDIYDDLVRTIRSMKVNPDIAGASA